MISIKLAFLTALRDNGLAARLRELSFPEGIQGTAEEYSDASVPFRSGGVTVLVTDSRVKAELRGDSVFVVLAADDIAPGDAERFDDVWSLSDGAELLAKRCEKLISTLRDRYMYEFYRTALLTTIDTVPDMLWYKRLDGIHMLVNNAFTGIVHKPKSDVIGRDHFYIWDAPHPAEGNNFACAESEEIAISTGKTYIGDEPVKTREGMKQFITYKTPYTTRSGMFSEPWASGTM